ncbi:hypothetical protein [Rhizobium leguminosarum]|uniref:NACHT domain-containing protein n=1 Tax=Rhizobium leguminosarum TaxID=384 RepID=UPI003F989DD7
MTSFSRDEISSLDHGGKFMVVTLKSTARRKAIPKAITEIAKAIAAAAPLLSASDPSAIASVLSASLPSLIEAAASYSEPGGNALDASAWSIVRGAYAAGLARFFATADLKIRPVGTELENILSNLLLKADIFVSSTSNVIAADTFSSPLKLPVLREAARQLSHELKLYAVGQPVGDVRRKFEDCLALGFADVRNKNPAGFAEVEKTLSGPLSDAFERRRALDRHHEFIIRGFSQKPIFGQEETGITLSDLYVRQRGIWEIKVPHSASSKKGTVAQDEMSFEETDNKQKKSISQLHIGDLHQTVWGWLETRSGDDSIRVIAGGPGSGKSTFARALAIEAIDSGQYDVLFVPLQDIEATGTFQKRIESLFRHRTELGLDRSESPLNWLGQRDPNGAPPHKPLLIVCDGLDEIAPPGSTEAASITTDFIQSLATWINSRNSGGLFVRAIILGRTISAQEAFRKLGIDHRALLRVAGLLPINKMPEFIAANAQGLAVDESKLSGKDQRLEFWKNWCKAIDGEEKPLPEALRSNAQAALALEELTTEPLLLYLLLWTGYLGENWQKAANNRNFVYEEIFQQIYNRRWGEGRLNRGNRQSGGHAATDGLDEADFFLLQEALGLASWATGGRTVTVEAFDAMLKLYFDPEKREDLSGNISGSLKSVALQGYTRSVEGENAGFEFVHKTIGEYLIARGLVTALISSLQNLRDRPSDSRCLESAKKLARIFCQGSLTSEIFRFFEDEIRIRFESANAKSFIDKQLRPFINWILKNGLPVNPIWSGEDEHLTFARLELADQRALDVVWSALQLVAREAYPWKDYGTGGVEGWTAGELKLDWPSPYSFVSLLTRLGSRILVSESRRFATFDFLDLRDQAVTDFTFGTVLFASENPRHTVRPEHWASISLRATNLDYQNS